MPFKVIVLLLRTKRVKMLFIHYVFDDVASKFYVFNKYGSAEMAKNLVDGQGCASHKKSYYQLNIPS